MLIHAIAERIGHITARKQAAEALKASENKFRIIADYTYDWESWHDNKGTLLWVNPAVERMTGRTMEECLAMREYPLPLIHPEDRHVFETLKVQALAGQSGNHVPFRIVREDHSASATWAAVSWNTGLGRSRDTRWIQNERQGHHRAQAGGGSAA